MWMMAAKGVGGFLAKRKQAKNAAAWTAYNNTMKMIQTAQQNNNITDNVALNRAAHAENDIMIKTSRLMAAAKVTANAAAAGVSGGAVEATLFQVGRNAAMKEAQLDGQLAASMMVTNQQRRQVAVSSQLSQQALPQGPSMLGAIGNIGLGILEDRQAGPSSDGTALEGPRTSQPTGWERMRQQLMI